MKDDFKFDDTIDPKSGKKKHAYTLNGKAMPSVSTILKVVGKGDALTQWSANLAARAACDGQSYDDARYAWKNTLTSAGDFGTNVHKAVENYVKEGPEYHPTDLTDMEFTAFNNFRNWYEGENAKLILSEHMTYSKEFWYAGTIDLVLEIDGKYWIGDVKTSGSIYPSYFLQTAAYQNALREQGFDKEIVGHVIINVKKDGRVDVKRSYGHKENFEAFLGALKLHKRLQALDAELGIVKYKK